MNHDEEKKIQFKNQKLSKLNPCPICGNSKIAFHERGFGKMYLVCKNCEFCVQQNNDDFYIEKQVDNVKVVYGVKRTTVAIYIFKLNKLIERWNDV